MLRKWPPIVCQVDHELDPFPKFLSQLISSNKGFSQKSSVYNSFSIVLLFFVEVARRREEKIIFKVMNEFVDALPYHGGEWQGVNIGNVSMFQHQCHKTTIFISVIIYDRHSHFR